MSFRVSRQRKLRIDLALIKITCNLKLKLTCNRTRPKLKGGGGSLTRQDKTRQDNVLFGVLYSPTYIDFIQII